MLLIVFALLSHFTFRSSLSSSFSLSCYCYSLPSSYRFLSSFYCHFFLSSTLVSWELAWFAHLSSTTRQNKRKRKCSESRCNHFSIKSTFSSTKSTSNRLILKYSESFPDYLNKVQIQESHEVWWKRNQSEKIFHFFLFFLRWR